MAAWLHWFRRDLRLRDNAGLYAACQAGDAVAGIFVIDKRWFAADSNKIGPFQASFWLEAVAELARTLARHNINLHVLSAGDPVKAVVEFAQKLDVAGITFNKDYEPMQIAQDRRLSEQCEKLGIKCRGYKDAVGFEEFEILTGSESPYTVFTPYKRAWLAKLTAQPQVPRGLPKKPTRVLTAGGKIPTASSLGFKPVQLQVATGESGGARMLEFFCGEAVYAYQNERNFPAREGCSRLSAHLSCGTVSPRQCFEAVRAAQSAAGRGKPLPGALAGCDTWLSELIWREFYKMILFHFPRTVNQAFQMRYADIAWTNDAGALATWKNAATGYPIVDAAIKQILATGWMHNRLRMIVAMFLTKDLDVDWRIGEQLFMQWLIDYDQAANVGGWQWSAGTGNDAAPYFRVMNPILQAQRYDPDGAFVRHWLPVLKDVPTKFVHEPWLMPPALQRDCRCVCGSDYPKPVVDHAAARLRAIARFKPDKPPGADR